MYEDLKNSLKEKFEYWESEIEDGDVLDFIGYNLRGAIQDGTGFSLYRYMPANYFNIRNIETQTIHLSPNGYLNDVYEGLPSIDNPDDYYKLAKLKELAYMTCLTEDNDNMLMWSHYANSHQGICVEYNLKQLDKDPFAIIDHLFPVIYGDHRIIRRDADSLLSSYKELNKAIGEHYVYDGEETLDNLIPLFLTKSSVWQYEKEWRILYTRKNMYDADDEVLYSCNLPFPCVKNVYLGYRIHPEIRKNIIEICGRLSGFGQTVKAYQAKLKNDTYDIVFDEIET